MPDPKDTKQKPQDTPPDREGYVEFEGLEIEIFRAGKYPQGEFTEEDLQTIADTYDPAIHEAPITLDHAKGGPSFGWIGKVKRVADRLVAIPSQVAESFKGLYRSGQYRKVSAEIYPDFMGMEGRPYLKAVTFLGARAPQVKGLAPAAFNEDFGEYVKVPFEKKEEDEMTTEEIKAIVKDAVGTAVAEFKEKNEDLKTQLEAKETEAAEFKEKVKDAEVALAERDKADKTRAAEAHTQRVAQFCEALKTEGKLLPAWEEAGLHQFMESLDSGEDKAVEFGEGVKAQKVSQLEFMEGFLKELPKVIDFEERGKGAKGDDRPAAAKFNEAADLEYEVDEESVKLRDRTLEIMAERKWESDDAAKFSEAMRIARRELAA